MACMCPCGRIWRRETYSSSGTHFLMVTRPGGPLRWSAQLRRASLCCWMASIGLTWELCLCCPGKPNRDLSAHMLIIAKQSTASLKSVWSHCRLLHDRELALYDGTRLLRWDRYLAMKEEHQLTDHELQERYRNLHPRPIFLWCVLMLLHTCMILGNCDM